MKVFNVVDLVPSQYYDSLDRIRVLVKTKDGYQVYYQLHNKREPLKVSCFSKAFKTEREAIEAMKKYDRQCSFKSTFLGEVL